ncbi:MAG: hypothetical protein AAFP99_11115 [Pseudomonadota bacterium]
MKSSLLTASILSAAMVVVPAAADAKSRLLDREPTPQVHQVHKQGKRHIHGRQGVLPPRAIYRGLYRKGFRGVHNVNFRKGRYFARAYGRRGLVRVTVDPFNGRVLRRKLIQPYQYRGFRQRPYSSGFTLQYNFN